jgi:hypothetical protein
MIEEAEHRFRTLVARSEEELLNETLIYQRLHTHTLLSIRAGYALAKMEDGAGSLLGNEPQGIYCMRLANERFSPPPKRVLREETDPNGGEVLWRYREPSGLEYRRIERGRWLSLTGGEGSRVFAPFPERIRLWADLLANPYREVPDNGDE